MELVDQRTGQVHDYTRRSGVVSAEVILPDGGTADRGAVWNAAEAAENRKDARTAREWVIALPSELDAGERSALALSFGVELARRYGVAVDVAIHAPDAQGDNRNHHAHVLTTTRCASRGEGGAVELGEKATIELSDSKRRSMGLGPAADEVTAVRALWEGLANGALERAGSRERIDRRTLEAQGIDREPTIHLGPVASEMERRGRVSDRAEQNRIVGINNVERAAVVRKLADAEQAVIDSKPIGEARAYVEALKPPSFEAMAEKHPAIAPTVGKWHRVQRSIERCGERLAKIGKEVAKQLGARAAWEKEGGFKIGFQKLARAAGAAFGALKASDAWLDGQKRAQVRTERLRELRQKQAGELAGDVRATAERLRPEIERQRRPLVARHERAKLALGTRELLDDRRQIEARKQANADMERKIEQSRRDRGRGR